MCRLETDADRVDSDNLYSGMVASNFSIVLWLDKMSVFVSLTFDIHYYYVHQLIWL